MFKKVRYLTVPMAARVKKEAEMEAPAGLWIKCTKCGKALVKEEFEASLKVCPFCGNHERLTAVERILFTTDESSFIETDTSVRTQNPLNFEGYTEKVEKLKKQFNLEDALITGEALIEDTPVLFGAMDANFIAASMGSVVGEKLVRLFERGIEKKLPAVLFIASGGARMQEGIYSLMQMAKVSGAVGRFSDSGGLYIAVLTDPTLGGVTASFAMLGDITLAEPGAVIGFTGRRVIEGTIGQKIPDNFQTAEFNVEHGFVDAIVHRHNMKKELGKILRLHKK